MPYVYVIAEEGSESPVKIGFADDSRARIDTLQPGNHRRLELKATVRIESRAFAFEVENRAHQHFSMDCIRGEWFDINVEMAIRYLRNYSGGRVRRFSGRQRPIRETPKTAEEGASA